MEYDQTRFDEQEVAGYFDNQTPEMALLSLPPRDSQGPQIAASMRLCGNQKPKGQTESRVGERAGNRKRTACCAQGAESRLPLKRGASRTRRGPTTEQRSRSCVPLGCRVHTHQAASSVKQITNKKRAPPHLKTWPFRFAVLALVQRTATRITRARASASTALPFRTWKIVNSAEQHLQELRNSHDIP
jgi:hypothetical protein